jgi:anaerobic selenocysteine-containing dehydrogenase
LPLADLSEKPAASLKTPEMPQKNLMERRRNTTCYMCACRCGIRVHLRDGEVRYIEGNPDHPLNQGRDLRQGQLGHHEAVLAGALTKPLLRKAGSDRGEGQFEEISWEEAYSPAGGAPAKNPRATDPKKFALFTGRDQMQALTGLFARQFGTPNYAAHGGFCSVNMAAGMIYTIGGSFWEFGGPDLDRAKLFVMIGTAEDHHSNPMKAASVQVQARRRRFIRSIRCAPAIRPSPMNGFRSSPAPTAPCCWP